MVHRILHSCRQLRAFRGFLLLLDTAALDLVVWESGKQCQKIAWVIQGHDDLRWIFVVRKDVLDASHIEVFSLTREPDMQFSGDFTTSLAILFGCMDERNPFLLPLGGSDHFCGRLWRVSVCC